MLRDYQQLAVNTIRAHYRQGNRRVLLHLPTGSGKTVVFSHILKQVTQKGKRAVMVVRGVSLVDQASDRLTRENVDHGVYQGDHKKHDPLAPVQVCSIDTLYSRKITPPADIVVIDEAHLANGKGYSWFIAQYPDAYFLPVTATPYSKQGCRHIASHVVNTASVAQLVQAGHLVPARYFGPTEPDLNVVPINSGSGDFNAKQLSEVMQKPALIGDAVEHYQSIGEGRCGICYCVDIKHSRTMAAAFNRAGIAAAHIDKDTPQEGRRQVFLQAQLGYIKIICNVNVLALGVDLPFVSLISMCRPTRSLIMYIQQAGRGTRPNPGKKDFILLDHAGNVARHGWIDEPFEPIMDGVKSLVPMEPSGLCTCKECYCIYDTKLTNCPECGSFRETTSRKLNVRQGTLKELTEKYGFRKVSDEKLAEAIKNYREKARKYGYKPGWVYFMVKSVYGEDAAQKVWTVR